MMTLKKISKRSKQADQGGITFIELQVAILMLGFVLLGLGNHLHSLTKQTQNLWNHQVNNLTIWTPFKLCIKDVGSDLDCQANSEVLSVEVADEKLEAFIRKTKFSR